MSGDQIGDSFSGDDSFDDLDSAITGDLSESFEKSFLALDLSSLDSSSGVETVKIVSLFGKAFKRVILNAFALLVTISVLHLIILIYLSASDYDFAVFFGLIFLLGYLYPIRVFYGLFKNRLVFGYLNGRKKIIGFVSIFSLVIATVLSAYPITRDYYHYYIPSPGTCLMLKGETESNTLVYQVSCFSKKAFQVLDYETSQDEACPNSSFASFYDTWNGNFCLADKRPPTEAELEILGQ